jgi:hypothetical protein
MRPQMTQLMPYLVHIREDVNGRFFHVLSREGGGAGLQKAGVSDQEAARRSRMGPTPNEDVAPETNGDKEPQFALRDVAVRQQLTDTRRFLDRTARGATSSPAPCSR